LFCARYDIEEREYPKTVTGSNGFHLYMKNSQGVALVEGLDDFPSIEIKQYGRQLVAAGSRHPNGNFYRWADGHPPLKDVKEAPADSLNGASAPNGAAGPSAPASQRPNKSTRRSTRSTRPTTATTPNGCA
jgi:hypothetical protein